MHGTRSDNCSPICMVPGLAFVLFCVSKVDRNVFQSLAFDVDADSNGDSPQPEAEQEDGFENVDDGSSATNGAEMGDTATVGADE
ncbi:hypothetical protein RRG08_033048 [Elysia crispata]|uniref:Uncharacterized protein n=1 Tax=Elysia crispata TaxID=231223 RepID=A0AAE1A7F2_9GAST|nr:hypothetical protein RRG08_033048 [Elysia crispata]